MRLKMIMSVLIIALMYGCCYNSAKLRILDTNIKPTERVLSYEGNGQHYQELRMALMDYGIKVLKYNVSTGVFVDEAWQEETKDTSSLKRHVGRIASDNRVEGSKYLVSINAILHPDIICLTGADANVYTLFVEITDIETHEVIFTIKAKGMDSPCGYCRKTVYEHIAERINEYFEKMK